MNQDLSFVTLVLQVAVSAARAHGGIMRIGNRHQGMRFSASVWASTVAAAAAHSTHRALQPGVLSREGS